MSTAHVTGSMTTTRRIRELLMLLVLLLVALLAMGYILPDGLMVDEHFHHGQILLINSPEFYRVPELTTPLGYHRSVALLARMFQIDSVAGLRLLSGLLGLVAVILAWLFLQLNASRLALLRSLQVLACPLTWPFYFLLYTDSASLGLVLATLILLTSHLIWPAALLGITMLAWRQNNVVWTGLFWLVYGHAHWLAGQFRTSPGASILHSLILGLPMLAFGVFLWFNGGIALGDHAMHRFGVALHPTQLAFLLLVLWLVLLPLHIAALGDIARWLRSNPRWSLLLATIPLLVMSTFKVTHPYNLALPDFHLRNGLLLALSGDWRILLAGSVAVTWSVMTLIITPLQQPAWRWLYPVTALALLPVELIEQRYYIVPVVLFLLLRQPREVWTERALLIWFMLISAALTAAIASTQYFL